MFKSNKSIKMVLMVSGMTGMILLTGCGGAKVSSVATASVAADSTGVTSIAGSSTNLLPPVTEGFEVTGPSGILPQYVSSAISTKSSLKVTLIAKGTGYVEGSEQAVGMNCIQYQVTVRPVGSSTGFSKSVLVSTTGQTGTGTCAGANPQPTMDFSSYLTSGTGQLQVVVQPSLTDNCRKNWAIGSGGCSLDNLYRTYHVTGTIQVHVNGTN